MKRCSVLSLVCSFCCVLALAGNARAQFAPTLTASAGYSNVQMEKAGTLSYSHDGTYLDVDALWSLPFIPVRLGIGLSGSDYWQRESNSYQVNNGFYYDGDGPRSEVAMFEIEPRIALHLGGYHGPFIEPSVGVGLLINSYSIDQVSTSNGNTYINTTDHTGAAFDVRPGIQAGYSWPFISAGVEASYMYAVGDFGGLGHNAQELRIGAFIKFNF